MDGDTRELIGFDIFVASIARLLTNLGEIRRTLSAWFGIQSGGPKTELN